MELLSSEFWILQKQLNASLIMLLSKGFAHLHEEVGNQNNLSTVKWELLNNNNAGVLVPRGGSISNAQLIIKSEPTQTRRSF